MKIYEDFLDKTAPCRDCENYYDGYVSENGDDFHEFTCSGGQCLYCAELNGFSCFDPIEQQFERIN